MNKTQKKRWIKVSVGLAMNAYPAMTHRRRTRLVQDVNLFIEKVTSDFMLADIEDWDGSLGECYVCDELSDFLWDRRYEYERNGEIQTGRFGNTLSCCIRAGFDMAVERSAGVLGYTVGDLRRIFPRELPNWICSQFSDPPALIAAGDNAPVWM